MNDQPCSKHVIGQHGEAIDVHVSGELPCEHVTKPAETQRQIKSEGGRTWRRTVRTWTEDWIADKEKK